ncbi:thiazole tautomerase TenI [Ectobacillus antri]|uniref:Thiazole tautomerase TenI n=1 Tax=Ectobacillus antri TaxID=2486280 RepID=A0ABT6H7K3_9BACI|nr:thiazole tautomerase TenI [Ectobacillus antri]MDG4658173.1 thiazole tautomerase TenI [Ectobacillus antri]MDG5755233.1 thiazole tautomerase TenI [Ectobacillus antri]
MSMRELHVISNGMSMERLVKHAMEMQAYIDYLHIRERDKDARTIYQGVEALKKAGFPVSKIVVNDRIDVALLTGVTRVQLGETGLPVQQIKKSFPFLHVGASVHSLDGAIKAVEAGADSLIYGHIFPTASKPAIPARGMKALQKVAEAISIPVVAIGGIQPAHVPDILQAGASGVAVLSGILSNETPVKRAISYRKMVKRET